jgi:37-kD nucleoid-associated bacterial protein
MSLKIRFTSAYITGTVLAKVGNPQRDEPLQTSKEVFKIVESDCEALTALFLKPFRNLIAHRFSHHSSLEQHEMNTLATTLFADPASLLEQGTRIAKRLYSKSNHANIKSGDLAIAYVKDIEIDGIATDALCILKAESVVPFLSISARNGDLQLSTEEGINPEKIDKGCLILNRYSDMGYYVLTFDRSGAESRFWVRDFLGVHAVPDEAFLTNTYSNLAVSFLEQVKPDETAVPEERQAAAREAIAYFEEKEMFDLEEFGAEVLRTPEAVAQFAEHVTRVEEEQGMPLDKSFGISKKDVTKAKKKIGIVLKFDTGVELHLKPTFSDRHAGVLERGFDEEKQMKFVKVYYNKED